VGAVTGEIEPAYPEPGCRQNLLTNEGVRKGVGLGACPPERRSQLPINGLCYDPDLIQELLELLGIQGLSPIRERTIGVGVDLHHEAVGSRRYSRPGHGSDLGPDPGTVTGIGDDREMGEGLHHRNRREIQKISGLGIEAPHTPLAENDVRVPLCNHIFGSQEELLNGGGEDPGLEAPPSRWSPPSPPGFSRFRESALHSPPRRARP